MTTESLQTFSPDKARIARAFAASLPTYEENAGVQLALAARLLELCRYHRCGAGGRLLEIGCGTGWLGEQLAALIEPELFWLNDLAPELCAHSAARISAGDSSCAVRTLVGDIEELPLPPRLDLVLSSSTLQWMADLPGLFTRINEALVPGGYLLFSIFGAGTMAEIAALSGRGLRYFTTGEVTEMLSAFELLSVETVEEKSFFPSLIALLRHIRNTGVGGLERRRWTRASLADFERRYRRHFGSKEGLPVTWRASLVVARKGGESGHKESLCGLRD